VYYQITFEKFLIKKMPHLDEEEASEGTFSRISNMLLL